MFDDFSRSTPFSLCPSSSPSFLSSSSSSSSFLLLLLLFFLLLFFFFFFSLFSSSSSSPARCLVLLFSSQSVPWAGDYVLIMQQFHGVRAALHLGNQCFGPAELHGYPPEDPLTVAITCLQVFHRHFLSCLLLRLLALPSANCRCSREILGSNRDARRASAVLAGHQLAARPRSRTLV